MVLGEFTDEYTDLGLLINIGLGICGWDFPMDVRDVLAYISKGINGETGFWETLGNVVLGVIFMIPLVGILKFWDDIGIAVKNFNWNTAADLITSLSRKVDDFITKGDTVIKKIDDWLDGLKNWGKYGDEVVETLTENVDELAEEIAEESMNVMDDLVEEAVEGGIDSVDDIIKGVENGDIPLTNSIQKGNYGEMKMDSYFESQGYERISLERVTDLNAPSHQGIDGVYYNPDGHPPYIIGEAKYGSSTLGSTLDGRQMSDNWVDKRLVDAVGEEMADDIVLEMMINPDNVQKQLVNISADGNVVTKILDEYANVVK